jgi:hypothetical protein
MHCSFIDQCDDQYYTKLRLRVPPSYTFLYLVSLVDRLAILYFTFIPCSPQIIVRYLRYNVKLEPITLYVYLAPINHWDDNGAAGN